MDRVEYYKVKQGFWPFKRCERSFDKGILESGKTDPSFSVVVKVSNALRFSLSELFKADDVFTDVNTYDKTLMEKLRFLDSLDDAEKKSIYTLIDSLISKKKLKDNLSNLITS